MPQSSSKVTFHIIFSTKDRHPWLDANVRPRMHAYLATVCRDAGAKAFRVGGVADHVHLVATLPRTLSLADMLEGLKKNLEMDQGPRSRLSPLVLAARLRCVFSEPEPSQLDALLEYVETQEEHHRSRTFQEEYREFLHKHGVEYDERYAWD